MKEKEERRKHTKGLRNQRKLVQLTKNPGFSEVETSQKQKAKKRMRQQIYEESYSESDTKTLSLHDESDLENVTLEDLVSKEDFDQEENEDDNITPGTYILVKFATKKKLLHYVALVENVEKDNFSVSYSRRKGQKFVFPTIPEHYIVP
ncbi:hypothetical protein HHI36_011654 [Cryptolaemus montrouzieri]|uniref:Uncharacterized protein n=1 Tax=Cryptolaemus montrouzieri TaxID=559131 RepID=A0ABD2MMD6_9CUCU